MMRRISDVPFSLHIERTTHDLPCRHRTLPNGAPSLAGHLRWAPPPHDLGRWAGGATGHCTMISPCAGSYLDISSPPPFFLHPASHSPGSLPRRGVWESEHLTLPRRRTPEGLFYILVTGIIIRYISNTTVLRFSYLVAPLSTKFLEPKD